MNLQILKTSALVYYIYFQTVLDARKSSKRFFGTETNKQEEHSHVHLIVGYERYAL